jgi:hypothetical protein
MPGSSPGMAGAGSASAGRRSRPTRRGVGRHDDRFRSARGRGGDMVLVFAHRGFAQAASAQDEPRHSNGTN